MFDSLSFALPANRYRSEETFAITLSYSAPAVSPVTLRAEDGSGLIQLAGRVPGTSDGSLVVRALGLDLHDAYGLLHVTPSAWAVTSGSTLRWAAPPSGRRCEAR